MSKSNQNLYKQRLLTNFGEKIGGRILGIVDPCEESECCNYVKTCETKTSLIPDPSDSNYLLYKGEGGDWRVNLKTPVSLTYDNGSNDLTLELSDGTTYVANLGNLGDNWGDGKFYVSNGIEAPASVLEEGVINFVAGDGMEVNYSFDLLSGDKTFEFVNTAPDRTVNIVAGNSNIIVNKISVSTTDTYTLFSLNDTSEVTAISPVVGLSGRNIATHNDGASVPTIVNVQESITTFVDNLDGTYTYTSEDGTTTTLTSAEQLTSLIISPDGSNPVLTYTDENTNPNEFTFQGAGATSVSNVGNIITISSTDTNTTTVSVVTPTVLSGHKIAEHNDGNGNIEEIFETETTWSQGVYATGPGAVPLSGRSLGIYQDETGFSNNINESITVITNNGDGTYTYYSENGTTTTWDTNDVLTSVAVSSGINSGVITYTDESLANTLIEIEGGTDITVGVVGNKITLDNTATHSPSVLTPVVVVGNTIATHADGTGAAAQEIKETITSYTQSTFSTGVTGGLLTGRTVGTFSHEGGGTSVIQETITKITQSGNLFTYTAEDGSETTWDVSSGSGGGGGSFTSFFITDVTTTEEVTSGQTIIFNHALVTAGSGDVVVSAPDTVTVNENLTTIGLNGLTGITYTPENNIPITLDLTATVQNLETVTTLVNNVNGSFTYTSEDGTITTYNEVTTSIALVDGGGAASDYIRYVDEDGANTDILISSFISTQANNDLILGTDGLLYLNVEDNDVLTNLSYTGAINTLTYLDENGASSDIALNNVTVTNVIAGNRIGTITNEVSTVVDINETITGISINTATNPTLSYDKEGAGANDNIIFEGSGLVSVAGDNATGTITITGTETTTTVTNLIAGNRIATYTDEVGTTYNIDESVTTITYNGAAHSISYTAEGALSPTVLDLNVGTLAYATLTNTLTYTAEDGTVTNINLNEISVSAPIIGNTISTITDEVGTTTDINETITALSVSGSSNPIIAYSPESGPDDTIELVGGTDIDISLVGSVVTVDYVGTETITTYSQASFASGVIGGALLGRTAGTFTHEDAGTSNIQETVTKITQVGTVFTYTSEDGTEVSWDVSTGGGGGFSSFFIRDTATPTPNTEEILSGQTIIFDHSTVTAGTGGVVVSTVDTVTINENLTTIALNGLTGITYTDEDGVATNLDLTNTVQNLETDTTFSLVDGGVGSDILRYVGEDGVNQDIILSSLISSDAGNHFIIGTDGLFYLNVPDDETITTLPSTNAAAATKNIATYTSEDGTITIIKETVTSFSGLISGNTIAIYKNENEATNAINETITTLSQEISTGIITYTREGGTTDTAIIRSTDVNNDITIGSDGGAFLNVSATETVTTLVDNANGSFTYTSENGTVTTYNEVTTTFGLINAGGGGSDYFRYTNEDGINVDVLLSDLISSQAQNDLIIGSDGLFYIDVTDVETLTNLSYTGATNTITYVDEDGSFNNIILNNVTVTNVIAGNRIATITNEVASVVNINETITTLTDTGTGGFIYTSENGTVTSWNETTTSFSNLISGHTIAQYTNEDGNVNAIDETITELSQNVLTGIITYTKENGITDTSIILSTDLNNDASIGSDGGIYLKVSDYETVTTMTNVIAGNRISTFTSENGTIVDINESITTLVDNLNNSFTYTSENGTTTTWSEFITSLTFNSTERELTYTKEDNTTDVINLDITIDNTLFVAKNGTDSRVAGDEHRIDKPFLTIAAAIGAASPGDTIHVFNGLYVEDVNISFLNLHLESGVILQGNIIVDDNSESFISGRGELTLDGSDNISTSPIFLSPGELHIECMRINATNRTTAPFIDVGNITKFTLDCDRIDTTYTDGTASGIAVNSIDKVHIAVKEVHGNIGRFLRATDSYTTLDADLYQTGIPANVMSVIELFNTNAPTTSNKFKHTGLINTEDHSLLYAEDSLSILEGRYTREPASNAYMIEMLASSDKRCMTILRGELYVNNATTPAIRLQDETNPTYLTPSNFKVENSLYRNENAAAAFEFNNTTVLPGTTVYIVTNNSAIMTNTFDSYGVGGGTVQTLNLGNSSTCTIPSNTIGMVFDTITKIDANKDFEIIMDK